MPASTGPLDPRGFYENDQGVVAPVQTVFNGGKRKKTRKAKTTRKNRKANRKTRRNRKH